ncbi:MAG: LLM class flavin-dependent oxidoreductase, partial [Gaiellaceae bacterium]
MSAASTFCRRALRTTSRIPTGACSSTSSGCGIDVVPVASRTVKLGFYMGYAQPGTSPLELIELAREAEQLGYSSAWAAEAWGVDAITPLAW